MTLCDHDPPASGDPVARFVYDGLGRMIRQVTHLDADVAVETDLYYDGVRRISERSQKREQAIPPLLGMFEMLAETTGDPISAVNWDELEYVWDGSGVSGSGGYVDEIAFVLTDDGSVRYALLDGNYNLMGWMRPNSGVMFQYAYGPYGDLRAADKLAALTAFPPMSIGHQGLFFVRLDGQAGDPPLTVGAQGLYYNRNRWYSPKLGRFTTCDVNETVLPILTTYALNGEAIGILFGVFNGQSLYADGMNLYQYLRSNPLNSMDLSGCFSFVDLLSSAYTRATGAATSAVGGVMGFARRIAEILNFHSLMTDLYLCVSTSAGQAASFLERLYQGTAQATRSFMSFGQGAQNLLTNAVIRFGQNANHTCHAFRYTDKLGVIYHLKTGQ